MAYNPCVLARYLGGVGFVVDVADPFARIGGAQNIVTKEAVVGIHTLCRVPRHASRPVVRDGIPIFADKGDVTLPFTLSRELWWSMAARRLSLS